MSEHACVPTSHVLNKYLLVQLHPLEVLHFFLSCSSKRCWVQLAVVHVVPCELVVGFWFTALVSTFVDLFMYSSSKVLVDDLARKQPPFKAASTSLLAASDSTALHGKGPSCRDLLHEVPRHECRQDRCRVRCDSWPLDFFKPLFVIMFLRSSSHCHVAAAGRTCARLSWLLLALVFRVFLAFVVDNNGNSRLVLLVTMHITSACRLCRQWHSTACPCSDKDVDMPVVVLDRCPLSTCRKLWRFRSCSSSIRSSRLCLATETCTHSAILQSSAAMGGVFAHRRKAEEVMSTGT